MENKNKIVIKALLIAGLLLFAAMAGAQDIAWLAPAAGDLVANDTVAHISARQAPEVSRETVTFSWPVDGEQQLELTPRPFVGKSREYWLDITAAELRAGVPMLTTSPGAVVRINPAGGVAEGVAERLAIDPRHLEIIDGRGNILADGAAMELLVDDAELAATDAPFAEGTSAFRLAAEIGAGRFVLRAQELPASDSRYVLHVFEPTSELRLELQTRRTDYLHGERLFIEAAFADNGGRYSVAEIDGFVTSPAGRAWPVQFKRTATGLYRARLDLDAMEAPSPGLWQAHVATHGAYRGLSAMRSARVGFAVAVPTARLDGRVQVDSRARGSIAAGLGIEVASAGRYEVRGILFGTDRQGEMRPIAISHHAVWFEPGSHTLALGFDQAVVADSGLSAPFEVRDLRLVDQGRMALLHRQARALSMSN